MKGRTVLVSIALVLCAGVAVAYAEGFKVYPNSKLDEKLTKEAVEMTAAANLDTKPSIYVTDDSFEKVKAFYAENAQEYQMPYQQPGKVQKLPSGKELKVAFFIFDGAKDLGSSKLWVKIQRPYIGANMQEGPDKTYINVVEKK